MKLSTFLRDSVASWPDATAGDWLEGLPRRIAASEKRWNVMIGDPFEPGGDTSFVAPATTSSGESVVYKCTIPHEEAVGEAIALQQYGGNGAVRVLESQPDTWEMLIERCTPGESLWTVPSFEERAEIATELMRRLWVDATDTDIISLRAFGTRWSAVTQRRLVEAELPWVSDPVERGADLLASLPYTAERNVLLHQDFHPGNVLAATREPWLVIDPKPVVGDPYFEPVQLLVQYGIRPVEPPPIADIETRLMLISSLLEFDPERIVQWAIARTAEWSMWFWQHGHTIDAAITYTWARTLDAMAPN